jgi:hypothetical protein
MIYAGVSILILSFQKLNLLDWKLTPLNFKNAIITFTAGKSKARLFIGLTIDITFY